MNLNNYSFFYKLNKRYRRSYGLSLQDIINSEQKKEIDFDKFEKTYLNPKQYEVFKDIEKHNYRKIIFNGAIGSGKTFLACYFLVKNLIKYRHTYLEDTNNFIVGNSIDSITTNTLKQIEKICNLLGIDFVDKRSNNTYCIIDNLQLKIYGGKNRDAFYKIRGSNTALVYVNEATLMHKETIMEVLKRLRVSQQTVIFDTNPDSPQHFFKKDYIDNVDLYKTYNFTIYDNPNLDKDFVKSQELTYKNFPSYQSRYLLGNWVASSDVLFANIEVVDSFDLWDSIMYIDPAFSVGKDNTAVCLFQTIDEVNYSFIYQDKKPCNDTRVLTMISKLIEAFNVGTVYIEDRDSINGYGALSKEIISLRNNMHTYFRIKAVKPKSNKHTRIMSLLVPLSTSRLKIMKDSSESVFEDFDMYKGDNKTADDALDALSGAYILNSKKRSFIDTYFSVGRYL